MCVSHLCYLFHQNTINRVSKFLKLKDKVENSLDIACGKGLSTKALCTISNNVYGTDSSSEMLKNAESKDEIQYLLANGENQPFNDSFFDIVTVCSGVHWLNIDRFLKESNRILSANGTLVLYDNFFISEMKEVPDFKNWFPEVYLQKFPSPKRNNTYNWSNENLSFFNMRLYKNDEFKNEIAFTKKELIIYFTTQSNITSVIESGEYAYGEIEKWLNVELSKFFLNENQKRTIFYGNWIKYLKPIRRKKGIKS